VKTRKKGILFFALVAGIMLSSAIALAVNPAQWFGDPSLDDGLQIPTAEELDAFDFMKTVKEKAKLVELDPSFLSRSVNEGFSGGEKKRNEIFQMAVLEPSLALLDETDSGLDIDALRIVAGGVNKLRGKDKAIVMITHYQRLLDYIEPDFVHVLADGVIQKTGDKSLAVELEAHGYDWVKENK